MERCDRVPRVEQGGGDRERAAERARSGCARELECRRERLHGDRCSCGGGLRQRVAREARRHRVRAGGHCRPQLAVASPFESVYAGTADEPMPIQRSLPWSGVPPDFRVALTVKLSPKAHRGGRRRRRQCKRRLGGRGAGCRSSRDRARPVVGADVGVERDAPGAVRRLHHEGHAAGVDDASAIPSRATRRPDPGRDRATATRHPRRIVHVTQTAWIPAVTSPMTLALNVSVPASKLVSTPVIVGAAASAAGLRLLL